MTRYIVGSLTTLSTMVFSNLYPADPVDPVIRVLLSIPPIVAPIYYRGMGFICMTLSGVGLPGVNLIIYKDDLRMMASKPVAAQESGMKDYEEGYTNYVVR
jgi:hypothetical protein